MAIFDGTQNRDPLVLELLEEIFAEGQLGQRGIHTLFIRYPTLRRGSIQCFRIVGLSSQAVRYRCLLYVGQTPI